MILRIPEQLHRFDEMIFMEMIKGFRLYLCKKATAHSFITLNDKEITKSQCTSANQTFCPICRVSQEWVA